jgi:hypothetical protein
MAERATLNQQVQLGVESTPGTAVAADRLIRCFNFTTGIESEGKAYRGTGRKYPCSHILNKEWTTVSFDGDMDFNGLIYILNSAVCTGSIAAHGSSSTAYDHTFTPGITGNATKKTYTIEQGDSVRAHELPYGVFSKWSYKFTRGEATTSGEGFGQEISDGITMTASPTIIADSPMAGTMWDVYVDTTSGGLGTTQLTRVLGVDFDLSNLFAPAWFINSSEPSWVVDVDTVPECTVSLLVEADATGMGYLTQLQSGDTRYLRVKATGSVIATDGPGDVNAAFTHDMAIKFTSFDPFEDSDGIYAVKMNAVIVEDTSWGSGQAQSIVLTNLLSAL